MAPTPETVAVSQAIDKADAAVLKSVLKSMCKASPICQSEAAQRLLVPATKRKAVDIPDANDAAKRRKAEDAISRYEKCETCKKVFDATKNYDDSCQTHPSYVDVDPDYFPDDDDIAYDNNISSRHWEKDWRFHMLPEGFIYRCCDKRANEGPCVVQRHVPAAVSDLPSSDDGEEDEDEDEDEDDEDEDEDEDEDDDDDDDE